MVELNLSNLSSIEELRDGFNTRSWDDELQQRLSVKEDNHHISLSSIYSYLQSSENIDEKIEAEVRGNLNLWKFYQKVIKDSSTHQLPEAMAASSLSFPFVRFGDDWKLTLETSQAETNQLYLIIEFYEDIKRNPGSIYIFEENEPHPRLILPAPQNNIIQIILDREDKIVHSILNPKTEVYLR